MTSFFIAHNIFQIFEKEFIDIKKIECCVKAKIRLGIRGCAAKELTFNKTVYEYWISKCRDWYSRLFRWGKFYLWMRLNHENVDTSFLTDPIFHETESVTVWIEKLTFDICNRPFYMNK